MMLLLTQKSTLTIWCAASSRSRTLPLARWRALGNATSSNQFYASCTGFHAAARQVQGRHPHPPSVLWTRSQLPGWRLLPRHRRPPKKTALGWHSYASRQSDADQLRRQSLQCSWPSSLKLSADGPQTARLVIQPFQTIAEDIFIWSVAPKHSMNTPLPPFYYALEIR